MRRLLRTVFLLVAAAATLGVAAPNAGLPLPTIAPGVKVGGVPVGGRSSEPARREVVRAFAQPLLLEYEGETWKAPVHALGAGFAVDAALSQALRARPGERIDIGVRVDEAAVTSYVAWLARRYRRDPVDSVLTGLVDYRPFVTDAQAGRAVRVKEMEDAIVRALHSDERRPIPLLVRPIAPKVTRATFGPVVVISRGGNSLELYDAMTPVRSFRVATGTAQYPTPAGSFSIVDMQRDPWWIPPASDWAKDAKPVPPGPGNPLGTRWMGISSPAVGIHGTPDAASLGYSRSHGCIRMAIPEAEWLFEQVGIGTPVLIV
jgi:lipoprotein-anchoring transpeptidase ErfK/SrfK